MPKMLIIDPCLFTKGGHEYVMNLFLVREAKRHGYAPVVIAHKQLFNVHIDFPLDPLYSMTPYDKKEVSSDYDKKLIQQGNKETFLLLSRHYPSTSLPKGSVILLHTACITLLVGLYQWLRKINRDDIKVRIVLRWPASRRVYDVAYAEEFCQKSINAYASLSCDVRFYSDSRGLVAYYEQLCGITFHQTPIGIHFHDAPPILPVSSAPFMRFVFAGQTREEKGFLLLTSILKPYIEKYPEDQFLLHTINNPKLKKNLESFWPQNVQADTRYLSGKAYFSYLMSGDVVLIPYNPEGYHLRTSHIFMEALGLGKAVIVSNNSWMAEVLRSHKDPIGVIMKDWTPQGLFDALIEMRENCDKILLNAYNNAYN